MSITKEFLLERPHYLARSLLYTFFIFVIGSLILSFFININMTTVAKGTITTEHDNKELFIAQNGILIDIFVTKGQHVKKGEKLAIISTDDGIKSDEILQNTSLLEQQTKQDLTNLNMTRQLSLHALNENIIRLEENELLMQKLYDEGLKTKLDYLNAKNATLMAKASLEKEKSEYTRKINELTTKLLTLQNTSSSEERKNLLANAKRGNSTPQKTKEGFDALYAPCDGVVALAQSWGKNMAINNHQPVFTIVPLNEKKVAKIEIPASQMTNIHPSQAVQLKIDAYPFQQFGIWRGTLRYISATSRSDAKGNTFYEATVELLPSPNPLPSLIVGQTLQADIVVNHKSIFLYLLDYLRGKSKFEN